MAGMSFWPDAQAVLTEARELGPASTRRSSHARFAMYRLGRPDAGWYQIRRALKAYGETELTDFDPFEAAYAALGSKLRPLVYELGFLPA